MIGKIRIMPTNISLEQTIEGLEKDGFDTLKIGHLKTLWATAKMDLKERTLKEFAMMVPTKHYEKISNIPEEWRSISTVKSGFSSVSTACDTDTFKNALEPEVLKKLKDGALAVRAMIVQQEHKFRYARDIEYKEKYDKQQEEDVEDDDSSSMSEESCDGDKKARKPRKATNLVKAKQADNNESDKLARYIKVIAILLKYVESRDDPLAKTVVELVKLDL
jgi:hypothetical protein